MRKIIWLGLFVITLALSSCSVPIYKHSSDCGKFSNGEMSGKIAELLKKENFQILKSDTLRGVIQAELLRTRGTNDWDKVNDRRIWIFQFGQGKINATAERIITQINNFGNAEDDALYCNDDTPPHWLWYWNVREGMEKMCGNKFAISKTKAKLKVK